MATFDTQIGFDMIEQEVWYGVVSDATATSISIVDDVTGKLGIYIGNFKYANGDIAGGTVTGFFEYLWDGSDYIEQFNATGVNLKALTVANLVRSGNSFELEMLAFKGNDKIFGSDFIDTLGGFTGNDVMWGYDGDDYLYGGEGNDVINGGNGDDAIIGGLGKDTLTGGPGLNDYFFDTKLGSSNVDKITDFVSGEDTLFLDVSIFTKLPESIELGDLADNLVIGTKALDSNDYLVFNPRTYTLSYDADGNGAGKAVAFVVLTGVTTISADDIWV
jgi:Ca2+-binding RTX toxin-like protein